jgi:hypothetical protein
MAQVLQRATRTVKRAVQSLHNGCMPHVRHKAHWLGTALWAAFNKRENNVTDIVGNILAAQLHFAYV